MYDELIGYLLNALEADERMRVEQLLEGDGDARKYLDILRRALNPLEPDREHVLAPTGLAARTCQQIRGQRST